MRRSACLIVMVILTSSLGACSTGSPYSAPTMPSTVAEYVDAFLDLETASPEQFRILEQAKQTGAISEADWKEVNEQSVQCIREKTGYEDVSVIYHKAGTVIQITMGADLPTEEQNEQRVQAQIDCSREYAGAVNAVYLYLYGGPMYRDQEFVPRAVYACLKEGKLIPNSVTWEKFAADYFSFSHYEEYGYSGGPGFECWTKAYELGKG